MTTTRTRDQTRRRSRHRAPNAATSCPRAAERSCRAGRRAAAPAPVESPGRSAWPARQGAQTERRSRPDRSEFMRRVVDVRPCPSRYARRPGHSRSTGSPARAELAASAAEASGRWSAEHAHGEPAAPRQRRERDALSAPHRRAAPARTAAPVRPWLVGRRAVTCAVSRARNRRCGRRHASATSVPVRALLVCACLHDWPWHAHDDMRTLKHHEKFVADPRSSLTGPGSC